MGSIRLSPNHGLNPSLDLCFVCGEAHGVAIPGRLKNDAEAPREAVWSNTPCDQCQEYMKMGVVLVSVRDEDEGKNNPHRTGAFVVVKDEFIERALYEKDTERVLDLRVAFVTEKMWAYLGLPREENSHVQ